MFSLALFKRQFDTRCLVGIFISSSSTNCKSIDFQLKFKPAHKNSLNLAFHTDTDIKAKFNHTHIYTNTQAHLCVCVCVCVHLIIGFHNYAQLLVETRRKPLGGVLLKVAATTTSAITTARHISFNPSNA